MDARHSNLEGWTAYPTFGRLSIGGAHFPCRFGLSLIVTRRVLSELRCTDMSSSLVLESLCAELLEVFSGAPNRHAALGDTRWLCSRRGLPVRAIMNLLDSTELARECAVHTSHLARTFRQRYGRSAGEFVRELRVLHAERLIRQHPQASFATAQPIPVSQIRQTSAASSSECLV
jgi:AraC-like DNA-binding protein